MDSRLLHRPLINVLGNCVAQRIGAPLDSLLQQVRNNLGAKDFT